MATDAGRALEEEAPSNQPQSSDHSSSIKKRVAGLIAVVAGLVSVVSAIVGLVFLFSPNLKPEPLPPARSAQLSGLTLDPNAPFSQYIQRLRIEGLKETDFTPKQLRERGALASFQVRVVGYKGMHLPLDWQLIEMSTEEELQEERSTILIPSVNDDSATKDIWVSLPRRQGSFRLEIQLLLQRGNNFVVLSRLQTRPFAGRQPGA
jgi:hypothetical protein